jgi:hypothetical protein
LLGSIVKAELVIKEELVLEEKLLEPELELKTKGFLVFLSLVLLIAASLASLGD